MRLNLQGKMIKIGFFNDHPPYTSANPIRDSTSPVIGLEPDIIDTMAEYFNFSVHYIHCHNRSIMNQMLMDKVIDFEIGGLMMTYHQHLRMNFFFTHWMDYITFGTRWSMKNSTSFTLLLKPFSYQVWFLFIVVFIVFIILNKFKIRIIIPIRIVQHRNRFNSQQYRSSIELNLLWINLSLLFRQPYHWLRYLDTSIKICVIFWTFSALILTTFYSGFISSILAIPIHDGITTVHQFAEQCESQNIIPLIRNNTSWANVFSHSKIDVFQTIWRNSRLINDTEKELRIIASQSMMNGDDRKFAMITARETLRYFRFLFGDGSIYTPPDGDDSTFYPILVSIPVRLSFEYDHQPFNDLIIHLQAAGLLERWRNRQLIRVQYLDESIDSFIDIYNDYDNNEI
ncbi:glutamate receptor delta-1 subunit precursor -like protein [Dermatophagoides farinae]|uniref:Glutamate receptor delta-1 subunit -like protein n=1 Tax=Dermatophagoides farinae TaxID=6954 RepID=A0A9D4NWH7_DERFA|nr:glutamate receptor delta-1 subunit precursor -like protein [Dermatophagoides farinae]